ncbi:hypothetical protein BDN72DRAFT_835899 [Pluteus cervinus]|uniref:Uncharacterized protein n=1 Tax=Pluteus cervinus TaxID=181527 RepID=A0ACD3B4A3_9AGAR|nr:hypothetical protein BDN72DRAFT_835899 [Pluteus cervinus]
MTVKFALVFLLAQALSASAQGALFYSCFPSNPSAATAPSICPAIPITIDDVFFETKCLCADIKDSTGNPSVICAGIAQLTLTTPTFDNICGGSKLTLDNTCADIDGLNNITNTACNGVSDVNKALSVLCAASVPADLVSSILSKYPIGDIILDVLNGACAAKPTISDINLICKGIDVLSTGCDLTVGTGSGNSSTSGSGSSNSSTSGSGSSGSGSSGSSAGGSGSSGSGGATSGAGSGPSSAPSPSASAPSSSGVATFLDFNYFSLILPVFVTLFMGVMSQIA